MRQNKYPNGWRTDNLQYNYIGWIDGYERGEIFNDKVYGFHLSFNLKHYNVKGAMRYSMGILKNECLKKRLKSVK
jgi:hypothetical protein